MLRKHSIFALIFVIFISVQVEYTQSRRSKPVKRVSKKPRPLKKALSPRGVSTKNLSADQKLRLETFREIWGIVNDIHFDRSFNGLGWRKLKYRSEKEVVGLKTDGEFYEYVNQLLGKLGVSHIAVIPPDYLQILGEIKNMVEANALLDEDNEPASKDPKSEDGEDDIPDLFAEDNSRYGIGVDLKVVGRDAFISYIYPDSAAHKAGLKAGYSIIDINGISVPDFIESLESFDFFEKQLKSELSIYLKMVFLNGSQGSTLSVSYDDGSGVIEKMFIERELLRGEITRVIPNMPPEFFRFEHRSLDDETGYIRFNLFTIQAVERMCAAITDFKSKKKIIIDLRGNSGGLIGAMWGITGLLVQKPVDLGVAKGVGTLVRYRVHPHKKNFKGEIAILIDDTSKSASEILTAGLQESGRVAVIGERSAGQALPSTITRLSNGALFQYPTSNFTTSKGAIIEGTGVKPDISVLLDKSLLRVGIDSQLDAALIKPTLRKGVESKVGVSVVKPEKRLRRPPPPRPAKRKRPSGIGSGRRRKPRVWKSRFDPRATAIIQKYIAAIGGADKLRKLVSLSSTGTASMIQNRTTINATFQQYRKQRSVVADYYILEGIGEFNEFFDGNEYSVQTNFGGTKQIKSVVKNEELKLETDFLELVNLKSNYSQVILMGKYPRDGRQVYLIEIKNRADNGFVLAFDSRTNLLVHRSGMATDTSYDDYRKTGDYLFPYKVSKTRGFSINLSEIRVNEVINPERLFPKLGCLDKVD